MWLNSLLLSIGCLAAVIAATSAINQRRGIKGAGSIVAVGALELAVDAVDHVQLLLATHEG